VDNDTGTDRIECVVLGATADSEFAVIQITRGDLAFGDYLTCAETGRRYQFVSCGLGSPDDWERGILIVQLAITDGLPPENALQKGMHLVRP
jgi:hypothetical protein